MKNDSPYLAPKDVTYDSRIDADEALGLLRERVEQAFPELDADDAAEIAESIAEMLDERADA